MQEISEPLPGLENLAAVPGFEAAGGKVLYKWRERFFAVLMWRNIPPQATDHYDSYQDAAAAAKKFEPTPEAFEVKKITERY